MASFGRLTAALMSASQENTLALANLNFDFTLIKCEAPSEYRGLGKCLSKKRKEAAEDGPSHITARKLGALFESDIPDVPNLIQAYGRRVTQIAEEPNVNPRGTSYDGVFADHVGADGTSIWATATSGKGVITMHLLACMLARIWTRAQAISIWSELVEQRQELLRRRIAEKGEIFKISDAIASRIELRRDQLADWDASARAWLRTADEAYKLQQTQLKLVLDNVSLPVSTSPILHAAIIDSWTKALLALESLIKGRGQRIQSGEVLLGLSSWHLYPDISVVVGKSHYIKQSDPLISPGGIITIGLHSKPEEADDGIYWSLPLAHMRYYGDPIVATRHTGLKESQVTFDQFTCVVLGSVLSSWQLQDTDLEVPLELITMLSESITGVVSRLQIQTRSDIKLREWMKMFSRSIQAFERERGTDKEQLARLISFGRRRCPDFIAAHHSHPSPVFGLTDLKLLLGTFPPNQVQQKIQFLRKWLGATLPSHDTERAVIEYLEHQHSITKYTYLVPRHTITRKRSRQDQFTIPTATDFQWTMESRGIYPDDLGCGNYAMIPPGPGEKPALFEFLCGHQGVAAVYLPADHIRGSMTASSMLGPGHNLLGVKGLSYCLKKGILKVSQLAEHLRRDSYRAEFPEYFESFEALLQTHEIYSNLPGARVNLGVTSQQLQSTWWRSLRNKQKHHDTVPLAHVFSCIAFFETGSLKLDPSKLVDALAVCNENSIFVASQLLLDPAMETPAIPVKRITGNIGRPGFSILIPSEEPKVLQIDCLSWNVVAHEIFDGSFQDSFTGTSLHLSLTGYELALDVGIRGTRDHEAFFIETAISLHDRGKWVADLDVIKAQSSWHHASEGQPCAHTEYQRADTTILKPLISVDSWIEFLDQPLSDCIVRAHGNTMARLAAASLAVQRSYDFRLVSPDDCWACLFTGPREESLGSPHFAMSISSGEESDGVQQLQSKLDDLDDPLGEETSNPSVPLSPLFAGVGELHGSVSGSRTRRVLIC